MRPKSLLTLIFSILLFHILADGLIMPVSAHSLKIDHPVSVLMSQLATSHDVTLGLWLFVIMFPYVVATIFFTGASDKYSRKIMLIRCFSFSSLGYFLLLASQIVDTFFLPLVGMMFLAIGSASTAILQAYIVDNCQTQFKKCYCFAVVTAIMTAAYVPMAQLSNYVLHSYQWVTFEGVAIIALFFSIISLLFTIFLIPNTKRKFEKNKFEFDDIAHSIAHIFSIPMARNLLVTLILFQFSWGIFFQNIYYHMTNFHHYLHKASCLFTTFLCFTSAILLLFIYPIIIRYFPLNRLIYLCFLFCSLGFILCSYLSSIPPWIIIMIIATGTSMIAPTLWTLLSNQIDNNHQGILMGLTGMIWAITWTLGGALNGILNIFSLSLPLQISSVLALIALLQIWLLNRNRSGGRRERPLLPDIDEKIA